MQGLEGDCDAPEGIGRDLGGGQRAGAGGEPDLPRPAAHGIVAEVAAHRARQAPAGGQGAVVRGVGGGGGVEGSSGPVAGFPPDTDAQNTGSAVSLGMRGHGRGIHGLNQVATEVGDGVGVQGEVAVGGYLAVAVGERAGLKGHIPARQQSGRPRAMAERLAGGHHGGRGAPLPGGPGLSGLAQHRLERAGVGERVGLEGELARDGLDMAGAVVDGRGRGPAQALYAEVGLGQQVAPGVDEGAIQPIKGRGLSIEQAGVAQVAGKFNRQAARPGAHLPRISQARRPDEEARAALNQRAPAGIAQGPKAPAGQTFKGQGLHPHQLAGIAHIAAESEGGPGRGLDAAAVGEVSAQGQHQRPAPALEDTGIGKTRRLEA